MSEQNGEEVMHNSFKSDIYHQPSSLDSPFHLFIRFLPDICVRPVSMSREMILLLCLLLYLQQVVIGKMHRK